MEAIQCTPIFQMDQLSSEKATGTPWPQDKGQEPPWVARPDL